MTLRPILSAVILACSTLAWIATGAAPLPRLNADDRAAIGRIEAYLNSIRSVQARFMQWSTAGQVAQGTLYLQRPKQLRLDYRPPSTLQVYANGFWLIFVDTELEAVTHVPLTSTPVGFLVADRVRLSGDVTVTRVEHGARTVRVHVVRSDESDAGKVVLAFDRQPLRLRNWSVFDPQGIETQVSLVDPTFNRRIDNDIFNFDDSTFED